MRISIITPSLNRRHLVRTALESMRSQGIADLEHVVVDGGSTDGTLELLAGYPELRLHVRADRNLYDALNFGIGAATGDVIGFLNTDDALCPGALGGVLAAFAAHPEADMVSGGVEFCAVTETGLRPLRRLDDPRIKALRERDVISGVPVINARFFRRRLIERVGLFDIRFAIAADRDFLMRAVLADPANVALDRVVYRYGEHAGSLSLAGNHRRRPLAAENLAVANTRLAEAPGPGRAHAAYRRWRAWALGYWVLSAGAPERAAALAAGAAALCEDPLWPARFARQLAAHAGERRLRAGVALAP
jgi:glycosyltransferase involved in cell wall biosynthesis